MRRLFSKNAKIAVAVVPLVVGCALAREGDPPEPILDPMAGAGGEGNTSGTGGGGTSTGGTGTGGTATGGVSGTTTGGTATGGTGGSTATGGAGTIGGTGGTGGKGGTAGAGMTGGTGGKGGTAGSGGTGGKGGTAGAGMTGGTGGKGGAAGGPPGGMELFRDDFQMGTANWTMTPSGVWSTSMDGSTVLGSTGATGSSAMRSAVAGETSWTDVQIDARVKITRFAGSSSGYYAGICARYQSATSYACFALRSNGQVMFRIGDQNTSATAPPTGGNITAGTWYTVRVVARGANITAFVNGSEIQASSRITASTSPQPAASGRIALASPGTDAVFDDIVVTTP